MSVQALSSPVELLPVKATEEAVPAKSSLVGNYFKGVDTAHKVIDAASKVLGFVCSYAGKGIKWTAIVLAYPVVLIVGGTCLLMWHGAKLAVAGVSRCVQVLDGALNR